MTERLETPLKPVPWSEVRKYQVAMEREGVLMASTGPDAAWYSDPTGAVYAGLLRRGRSVRIKAIWTFPEWRGWGIGTKVTDALIELAEVMPDTDFIDVIARNPAFYEARGFTRDPEPVGIKLGPWWRLMKPMNRGDHE